jgi:hypothetical protein
VADYLRDAAFTALNRVPTGAQLVHQRLFPASLGLRHRPGAPYFARRAPAAAPCSAGEVRGPGSTR